MKISRPAQTPRRADAPATGYPRPAAGGPGAWASRLRSWSRSSRAPPDRARSASWVWRSSSRTTRLTTWPSACAAQVRGHPLHHRTHALHVRYAELGNDHLGVRPHLGLAHLLREVFLEHRDLRFFASRSGPARPPFANSATLSRRCLTCFCRMRSTSSSVSVRCSVPGNLGLRDRGLHRPDRQLADVVAAAHGFLQVRVQAFFERHRVFLLSCPIEHVSGQLLVRSAPVSCTP